MSEINLAIIQAKLAYDALRKTNFKQRAELMNIIADEIEALDDILIQTAHLETNLPLARLIGEKARTIGQWRSYASSLLSGNILDIRIDTALPERTPPRPDIRKTYIGLGPVVIFGASNFPFAFSTAGGDTASAIAAGCSVIVKGHPAHPKTAEIMGNAITRAVSKAGFHKGTFKQLFLDNIEEAQELIKHETIKAVGFTGSYKAGKNLFDVANQRKEPIPVFAEMGSVNPVFVLPEKFEESASEIAAQYIGSLTLGVGQFCTNPGLLIIPQGKEDFFNSLIEEAAKVAPSKMLHAGISEAYSKGVSKIINLDKVRTIYNNSSTLEAAAPILGLVTAEDFINSPELQEEIFGPFGLIITYSETKQLSEIAKSIKGQLTSTVLASENEISNYQDFILDISNFCGRILFNGYPTGVEVVSAMHHGGPFPSSTDSRFTSVGPDAIKRFARPICYQNTPSYILPDELKNNNPLGLYRLVDGIITKEPI